MAVSNFKLGLHDDGTYTDPQTGYEYASLQAFYAGNEPIAHWRNAQIRKIRQAFADEYVEWRVKEVNRLYDKQGHPLCACGEHHARAPVDLPSLAAHASWQPV
jgi:hypothetical protein